MDSTNTMEYRIGLEKQNKRNDQVTELILDNCRASQISGLSDEFVNLETLSLINVGLVTLKGFPTLPKLRKLELSDNRLTGGLNLLRGSPNLQHLNISGNRIKDLESLEPLKGFPKLETLDLYNCEVTKTDDYRKKVFELLPSLHSLDGYDKKDNEVMSDESDTENRIIRDGDGESDEEDYAEEGGDERQPPDADQMEYNNLSDSESEEYEGDDDAEDEEDDDDDDDDDDDEDDDDSGGDENFDESDEASEEDETAVNSSAAARRENQKREVSNGDDSNVQEVGNNGLGEEDIDDDDEDGDDDDDDDDEDDDESGGEVDLKQLEKDEIDDESDDGDFEPSRHEPDARDHEIDPEDDADEDDPEESPLSTSKLDTTSTSESGLENRGQKRKHEDEGGDEIEDGN